MSTPELSDHEYLFTSESVTEGHPDKVADQISDGVLDAVLADDPTGRVACETLVNTGLVVVSGEISTETYVDIQDIARSTIRRIGYTDADLGFSADSAAVINAIDKQSPDIAQGVDKALESRTDPADDDQLDVAGAGDQGMMFGYATRETPELMPLPIALAHKLAHRLAQIRKGEVVPYLRPDGKTQVTVRYENGRPIEIEKILISTQHRDGVDIDALIRPDLWEHVVHPVLPAELYDERKLNTPKNFLVNPTGRFVIGGPVGDCGLTGRKIIVDTYGGMARHGGGAFSGKDPSKVDRSAAYAARYVAKNVVAAGLADRCEVQVAYAIGVAHPVSVMVETFGTEKISRSEIARLVRDHFDLRPGAFREYLNLHRPIFQKTAAYGHFGREDSDFTWEKTDKADALRQAAGLGEREGAARLVVRVVSPGAAHAEQRHRLGQALETAAAGERPGVVPPGVFARVARHEDASRPGELGDPARLVHRRPVHVARAAERRAARHPGVDRWQAAVPGVGGVVQVEEHREQRGRCRAIPASRRRRRSSPAAPGARRGRWSAGRSAPRARPAQRGPRSPRGG